MMATLLLLLVGGQEDAARWVERLSSDSIEQRDEAERRILELGEAALPALKAAAAKGDVETAGRAARLARLVVNRKILTPRLRASFPGLENEFDPSKDDAWLGVFLEAARIENGGVPRHARIRAADLLSLVEPALRAAKGRDERMEFVHVVHNWKLGAVALRTAAFLKGDNDQSLWEMVSSALHQAPVGDVAPALEPVLTDPSSEVRSRALRLLRWFKAPATREAALRALRDPDRWVPHEGFELLEALEDPAAVPALLPLLKHEDPVRRSAAAHALARLHAAESAPHVRPLLRDPEPGVRAQALHSLGWLKDRAALPEILPLARDEMPDVREAWGQALAQLGGAEDAPRLLPLLEDVEERVRWQAVHAVGELKARGLAEAVARRLHDAADSVREQAVETLAELEAREFGSDVLPLFDDPSEGVRREVVRGAGRLGLREAARRLLPLLDDEDLEPIAMESLELLDAPELLAWAVHELGAESHGRRKRALALVVRRKDPSVLPVLFEKLESGGAVLQDQVLEAIQAIGGPELIPRFLRLLESPNEELRTCALDVLWRAEPEQVVPRALELLRHAQPWVRALAARLLRVRNDEETDGETRKLLDDPDPGVRRELILLLDPAEEPEAVPGLIGRLRDPEPALRAAAADRLSAVEAAREPIFALLQDPSVHVRRQVFESYYGRWPPERLGAAVEALAAEDERIRQLAFHIVGQAKRPELAGRLRAFLESPHPEARAGALQALGVRAGPKLRELADDEDNGVRWIARDLLAQRDGARAVPYFAELLDRPEERIGAVSLLERTKSKEALPPLLRLLRDGDESLRPWLLPALAELGAAEIVPLLLEGLNDENEASIAIRGLAVLKPPAAIPALVRRLGAEAGQNREALVNALGGFPAADPLLKAGLDDPDAVLRRGALLALWKLKRTEAAEAIRRRLDDPEAGLREIAVECLAEFGDRGAGPALAARLKDPEFMVRQNAIRACGTLRVREALPELRRQLADPADPLRTRILEALAKVGEKEDVGPLRALTRDAAPGVREAAVAALGAIGAREAAPELLEVLRRDGSSTAARFLGEWGVKEAVPDLERRLPETDGVEIPEALCRLGSSKGASALLRMRRPFALHALRSPEAWARWASTPAAALPPGKTFNDLIEAQARAVGLGFVKLDGEGDDAAPGMPEAGAVLDVLRAFDGGRLTVILDGGSLRILTRRQATARWRQVLVK